MGKPIRVLLVEDSPDDAELVIRKLKRAGYEPEYERVDSPEAMREALEREWDVILSDHEMPRFSAPAALRLLNETGRDIPFIILSGAITVELAGDAMREGARDFIPKNRLSLLGPAIERELEEFRTRRDKIRAEEELVSSREKFEKITSSMQDAVMLIDAAGSVVYWNPAAEKIFGYSMEDAMGRNIHSLITPKRYLDAAEKGFEKFMKTGEGALIGNITELFGLKKDGEEFPLELSISSIRFHGQYHAVGIVRDITERKEVEDALHESSRLLEESQRVANLGTYNLDVSSGMWSSSSILDRIFGIADPEFIRDVEGWLKIVHPEQREEMKSYLTNHVLAERNRFDKEYRIIRLDDKQERWVHGLGEFVMDENQNPIKMIGTIQDITERKKVEAERNRLAVGIEQAGETIVMTDTDGDIVYVNPQFEKITGYSREEAIGINPRILKSGKQGDAFYKNLWAVITAGKVWKGCFVNRRKDGSLFDEEATISPVFNDKGEIINYVAVKHDITETAMLERAREHFTTITSHELKTPQVKLQLGIERLKSLQQGEFDRERFDDALKALKDTEHDFNHIITGALLLAKLSEPVTSDMMDENYIFAHIESAVYKTRSLMAKEKRNVEIEMDTSRLPARTAVYGNRKMISRAIEEILSNAVKYTPDGKKVTVTARAEEKKAVILISDEGPGVPKAKKKVALDAYSSLESTLHHSTGRYLYEGGGLGLGLTLARLIMDHHHGRMEIYSGGSKSGTTVVLSFPTTVQKNSGKD
jgi:PAS domain S-box-containing protein